MELKIAVLLLLMAFLARNMPLKKPEPVQVNAVDKAESRIEEERSSKLSANKIIVSRNNPNLLALAETLTIKAAQKLPNFQKSQNSIVTNQETPKQKIRKLRTHTKKTSALTKTSSDFVPIGAASAIVKKPLIPEKKKRKAFLGKLFGGKKKNKGPLGPAYKPPKLGSVPEGTFDLLNSYSKIEKFRTDDDMADILDDGIDAQNRDRGVTEPKDLNNE